MKLHNKYKRLYHFLHKKCTNGRPHQWHKCHCQGCGARSPFEEDHSYNGCICAVCGQKRSEGHSWQTQTPDCSKCAGGGGASSEAAYICQGPDSAGGGRCPWEAAICAICGEYRQ